MSTTRRSRRTLAERIARDLFTNSQGQRATRLVLTVDGDPPRDLGGLAERVVVDRIIAALEGQEET